MYSTISDYFDNYDYDVDQLNDLLYMESEFNESEFEDIDNG